MSLVPSMLLMFDTSALLAGKTADWQQFAKLGECYVPEAVLEQMEYMCDRASEPEVEGVAREFQRFFPTSGWKKINLKGEHPLLQPAPGHTLSRRARLSLDVLGCAYGTALRYRDRLIVLVANDQPMLQQVNKLEEKNLCGMPVPALLQWMRSQRRPAVVNQHLQLMRSGSGNADRRSPINNSSPRPTTVKTSTSSIPAGQHTAKRQRSRQRSLPGSRIVSNLVLLLVLVVGVLTIWRFVNPASFNQFWQSLPILGKQQ